jgi:hypothetical protein
VLKKVVVGAMVLGVAALVLPVIALPSVEVNTDVQNVQLVGECASEGGADPMQTWEIALSVTVTNTNGEPAKFAQTGFYAKFNSPSGPGQISNTISVVDPGGFVPGEEIPTDGGSRTYSPIVRATIPCDATSAVIFATLVLEGRDKTYQDGATFLDAGTPVPLGPTGVLGIAFMVGAAGLLAQRLGRRPASLRSTSRTR